MFDARNLATDGELLPSANGVDHLDTRLQSISLSADDLLNPPDNSDTRSVASRTTMTLDEKDSLRPDDSASVQAATDQDQMSAVDDSRNSSEPEAHVFRDQLRQIDLNGQVIPSVNGPPHTVSHGQHIAPSVLPSAICPVVPMAISPLDSERQPVLGGSLDIPPDEKLLEALASPPDRVFVLKVEQDLIDFIKNPREQQFELPQMNSFYRMLSHKLADYYMLGHNLNDTMTAVRVMRTANCRLPPRLIDIRIDSGAPTPSSQSHSRMILRRERLLQEQARSNDPSTSLERNMSQFSSNTPSETGTWSGGDNTGNQTPNKGYEKSSLTLEERENRYKEARARIFGPDGKIDTNDSIEEAAVDESREISRSSSTSGAKKAKKAKKPKDDTFEGRSAYSQMNGQAIPNSALASLSPIGVSSYDPFNMFQGANNTPMPQHTFVPAATLQYGPMSIPQHQSGMSNNAWYNGQVNQGAFNQSYDNFCTYDQSHPLPPDVSAQDTPRATFAPVAGFPQGYRPTMDTQGWQEGAVYGGYTTEHPSHAGMPVSQYSSPGVVHLGPYGLQSTYGPSGAYDWQYGSFDRPQFNPNSQTFVPTNHPGQGAYHPGTSMNGQSYQYAYPMHQSYQNDSTRNIPGLPLNLQGKGSTLGASSIQQRTRPPPAVGNSSQSSIAKWGTPSTLPPKPPPPAVQSPYYDLPRNPKTEQPLPPNPFASDHKSNHASVAAGSAK